MTFWKTVLASLVAWLIVFSIYMVLLGVALHFKI